METKAIFLDVDGTLVSFDTHRVPQSAIEALQQVHESGIKIIIATGRAFTDLHELEEIPYDAVIALNGSDCVLRDGTPISRKQIPEKDFQRVLVLAQHYGFALAIETNKGIFVNELNPTVIELARLVNHPTPPVADIEKDFVTALEGIRKLPDDSRLAVMVAYRYYTQLLKNIKKTPAQELMKRRIRVSDSKKVMLLVTSVIKHKLNLE